MAKATQLERQVERILDEQRGRQVDVIVQMESDRGRVRQLARAAGAALSRRRLSMTPRDLLPGSFRKKVSRQARQETASTRTLLGRATAEALTLAKIQKLGLNPMQPLLQKVQQAGAAGSQAGSDPSQAGGQSAGGSGNEEDIKDADFEVKQ